MVKYIVFQIYEDICAVKVDDVHEIIEIDSMIKTTSSELNLINWGGMSLPVIDPTVLIALTTHVPTVQSRILILEENDLKFGLLINKIMGIIELDEEKFRQPSITDPRYVKCKTDEMKIFAADVFLSEEIVKNFREIYKLDLAGMDDVDMIIGEKSFGKEELIEKARLRSLNWLISATRKEVDEEFINEALEIHNIISKMK